MLARKSTLLALLIGLLALPVGANAQDEAPADEDIFADDAFADDVFPADEDGPALEGQPVQPTAAPVAEPVEAEPVEAEPVEAEPASLERHEDIGALRPGSDHPAVAHEGAHDGAHHFSVTDFIPTVVNFLIWLAIVVLLLRKPLMTYLRTRRLAVIEGLEQSKRLREAAEQKHAEYTDRLKNLDQELAKLRQEMIQAGEAERDRLIAEAEARAARMRRDAQFVVDQQMKQLKTDLTREAIEAAIAAAEHVLRDQTGATDQQRLADGYLGNLEGTIKDEEVRA